MSKPIEHVGYVGMGIMGAPMALNLLKAGFAVTVWNRTPGKCDAVAAAGGRVADSLAALAQARPDVVCLNVTDTPDVEAVLFGPGSDGSGGLAAHAARGLIVIDHSTISPTATQGFNDRLARRGVTLLDAPVSGGDVGAQQGTLSIMVGGDEAAYERCLPVLRAVGKAITRVGGSGMGQACKACNQIAVVNALVGVCEALRLARKLGLDARAMIDVVGAGAGGSWQLSNLGPKIAAGDFNPGFMVDYVLKDLAIVRAAAAELGMSLDATAAVEARFRQVQQSGGGRLGTQALAKSLP